jgi:hypothetical protein
LEDFEKLMLEVEVASTQGASENLLPINSYPDARIAQALNLLQQESSMAKADQNTAEMERKFQARGRSPTKFFNIAQSSKGSRDSSDSSVNSVVAGDIAS